MPSVALNTKPHWKSERSSPLEDRSMIMLSTCWHKRWILMSCTVSAIPLHAQVIRSSVEATMALPLRNAQAGLLVPTSASFPFSQQSCNTACQERQTDCALRCDQDAPCIKRCRADAEDCTKRCVGGPVPPNPPAAPQTLFESMPLVVLADE